MKVSFVTANPFVRTAPVPPFGPERLTAALLARFPGQVECAISVPFLRRDWKAALVQDIKEFCPDLVGISFRNLDDALAIGPGPRVPRRIVSRSALPALLQAISVVRSVTDAPLLIGGTGFSCAPTALLRATGIKYGVVGPGEEAMVAIVGQILDGVPFEKALEGLLGRYGVVNDSGPEVRRDPTTLFGPVITPRHPLFAASLRAADDRFPVLFSFGCNRRCSYCIEPGLNGGRVSMRPTEAVVAELMALAARGVRKVWLSASELNVPSDRPAIKLFREIARLGLRLDIRSYLAPSPVSEELFDAMEAAGQRPWEWTFDFGHLARSVLAHGGGPSPLKAQEGLLDLFIRRGYPVLGTTAIFGGLDESEHTIVEAARRMRAYDAALPEGFGLTATFGVRIYPTAKVGQQVLSDPAPHKPYLWPRRRNSDGLLPIFYCKPLPPWGLAAALLAMAGPMKGGVGFFARLP